LESRPEPESKQLIGHADSNVTEHDAQTEEQGKETINLLKIEGLKQRPGRGPRDLVREAARLLRVGENDIKSIHVLRRSVDAREDVELVYTVAVDAADEEKVLRRIHIKRYAAMSRPRPMLCRDRWPRRSFRRW